jgi:putative SOS response-associated peptidase YedK
VCGRFSLITISDYLSSRFNVTIESDILPRYNIAPGTDIGIIKNTKPDVLSFAHWGLIPHWAKEKTAYSMINARAETLLEKPAYKGAFQQTRCLIPADGFYEWKKSDGIKVPYRIVRKDGGLFAFAGLFDRWEHEGKRLVSCTIITTDANEMMKPIHDRMPVVLRQGDEARWLANTPVSELQTMLKPYPDDDLMVYQISDLVNSPKNEGEAVVRPIKQLQDY